MKAYNYNCLVLIVLFATLISCGSEPDNNENGSTDSGTVAIDKNTNNQEFTLPEELVYTSTRHEFNYDKFYPIGWSKDGKFAYIMEPADEGSGFYLFEIVIIDIVNDKIIWSWKPEESEEGSLQVTWKENYDLFARHLNEVEINQTTDFKLAPTSISYKGNDYEIVMETVTEVDPDYGVDLIKEVEINLQSPELGEKQIFSQKIDSRDYILSAYVPGYLMSPHDDRIVVICQKERIGAGGPPNIVFFEIIGSNLIRGFKKENDS